jgi:hypothetical protein
MTVQEAIKAAESLLPGVEAAEGEIDPRWQAMIVVGEFVETEPEAVWSFVEQWGSSPDEDLRAAVATCLLEHLLEHHFDRFISRVEQNARKDRLFADMVARCWKYGQAEEPARAARFDRLRASIRRATDARR